MTEQKSPTPNENLPENLRFPFRPMNARTQECFGFFGYGSGYFMADSRRASAQGFGTNSDGGAAAFCNLCPQAQTCWSAHREKVTEAYPSAVAVFSDLMRQVTAETGDEKHAGAIAVKKWHDETGMLDPWMQISLNHLYSGMSDRVANAMPKDAA